MTMNDSVLREALVQLLTEGHAHVAPKKCLAGLDPSLRGKRPGNGIHSAWEEVEHLRLAQEDILRYTLDAAWKSPPWPEGYWPPADAAPSDAEWKESVRRFLADLDEVAALARDASRDLTATIPHGEGRTYLRQVLLVADHNAYHLGQIVQTRKLLGAWNG
jgi:uncharacterized damage-inducible protein DinB